MTRGCEPNQMIPADQELLERALEGDEGAFAALYRLRQGAVYRFALHMSGSAAVAEDVTQDTFLELLKAGRRYDAARGTLRSFLFGVARNFAMRRIGRVREEPLEEDATDSADVLGDLTRRETVEQVRCAVLTLPAAYREAVVLCDLEDASYEEAAVALDCPVGTVRSRLSRARAMLAKKLGGVRGTCHV
jgi:RNA polymerase sigma-70 factor, ECF subfamily